MNSVRNWSALLTLLAVAGCSGDDSSPAGNTSPDAAAEGGQADATTDGGQADATTDGGQADATTDGGQADVTTDRPMEAAVDATAETSVDAAPETSVDGAPETSVDGAGDSGADAGSDSGDAGATDSPAEAMVDTGVPASVIAEPGYSVTLWATGTAVYFNPDSIDYDGAHYWVGYQNKTTKDGSDGGAGFGTTSTIVEYAANATVMGMYSMPGHCDGLRVDPVGHKVWATSNEDGNPHLVSIDPSVADASAAVVEYTIVLAGDASTDHGGGYDDVRFLNGSMFIAASNPSGAAHVQSLDMVTISGTTATFTPVLYTDSVAIPVGGDAPKSLSLTDPDSIAVDDQGHLVLVSQGDSQLIFISNTGMPSQSQSVLTVATQPEDPVWITKATGRMLLVDGKTNAIYEIHTTFTVGTVFTAIPYDSTLPGILATVDLTSGVLSPKIIGFNNPTGLIFVPSP
jgi:hypothetical protein